MTKSAILAAHTTTSVTKEARVATKSTYFAAYTATLARIKAHEVMNRILQQQILPHQHVKACVVMKPTFTTANLATSAQIKARVAMKLTFVAAILPHH